jgi:membrane protein CcdC involved in cytochrome C biogenesis
MSWSNSIRQTHRWVSILFTLTVVANFVVRAMDSSEPPAWITYSPLPPLFLQLLTGLFLFALPYTNKRRGTSQA